jgi:D-alanyl-D-alanine carboxypeptidase
MRSKQIRFWALALAVFGCHIPTVKSADATAPTIQADWSLNYLRLTWPNVTDQVHELLTSRDLGSAPWSTLVTLTTDSKLATWTDEAQPSLSLFYEVTLRSDTNWASRLQLALDRTRKSAGAKGMSAVVISSNGVWQGTSGLSDPKTTNSIQPPMRFGIGSITKTFTAALIMKLVEEGKLTLEDPLSKWLPPITNITNSITIRQLLSHTSGVSDFYQNPKFWPLVSKTNHLYLPADTLQLVEKPQSLPGKGFYYSDSNFVLLGMIAEVVTSSLVEVEIRRRFLGPLQLRSTFFRAAEPDSGERAHPFSANYTGSVIDVSDRPWLSEWSMEWTAGGMMATAYDLAHWIQALYGGTVLKPESLTAMTQWTSLSGSEYGLGTLRLTGAKGEFWGHGGGITGYQSIAGYAPSHKTTVVLLANQDTEDLLAIWNSLLNGL